MSFLDEATMIAAFGEQELRQLTDRERTGTIDSVVLAAAIERAESEAAAIMRRRYPAFPTPVVPKSIVDSAADIARFYLHDKTVPEVVAERFAAAQRFLRDAVFAAADLGLPEGEVASVEIAAPTRAVVFGDSFGLRYDGVLNV